MKMLLKTYIVISALFFCVNAFAEMPEYKKIKGELEASIGFTYANFENGKVEFHLPQIIDLDWHKFAPQKIKAINMNKLTKDDIDFIRTGKQFLSSIYLNFILPIPEEIKGKHFYLITSQGIEELTPTGLAGNAKFHMLAGDKIVPEPIQYYGSVITDAASFGNTVEGGFVMSSSIALKTSIFYDAPKIQQIFSVQAVGRKKIYSYIYENKKLTLDLMHRDHLLKIDHVFTFKIDGIDSEYLFVNWHPDDKCTYGCCGNGYSLFQADQDLRELTSTVLGCDV